MTCLAVALSADSGLWPDGILDVPTAQGTGLATVAYDAATDTSHFWLLGDVQGGQGYVLSGNIVASLLSYNIEDAGPSYIRFFGDSALELGAHYRLATSNAKVVPGSPLPSTMFLSQPFWIQVDSNGKRTLMTGQDFGIEVQAGWNVLAPPLETKSGTLAEVLPVVPEGTLAYVWDSKQGYTVCVFDGGEWLPDGKIPLVPGIGVIIRVLETGWINFTGDVILEPRTVKIVPGWNLVGCSSGRQGLLQTELGYAPEPGDTVLDQVAGGAGFHAFVFDGKQWVPEEPVIYSGHGYWIQRRGDAVDWTPPIIP